MLWRVHNPGPTFPSWEIGHCVFRQAGVQLLELAHEGGASRQCARVRGTIPTRNALWLVLVNTISCLMELTGTNSTTVDAGAVISDMPVFLTMQASYRLLQILVNRYQVLFNVNTLRKQLITCLWVSADYLQVGCGLIGCSLFRALTPTGHYNRVGF